MRKLTGLIDLPKKRKGKSDHRLSRTKQEMTALGILSVARCSRRSILASITCRRILSKKAEKMTPQAPPAKIRDAILNDLPAIQELLDPYVQQRKLLPRTTSELGELLKHGFVAESEGRIVGFAALNIYSKKLAEIQCLAVVGDSQRQGIGKRLVEACVQRACDQGVLEVMAITSSETFLMACGFNFALPGERKALFFQTREH